LFAPEREMTTRVLLALMLGSSVACGGHAGGPPDIQVDRTACSHCGMLVSEPVYAAAYKAPSSDPRVFDDIRCLLEAARTEPRAEQLRFWFHDAAAGEVAPQGGPVAARGRPGGQSWIEGSEARFVASPALRTPMGGGLIAYRDRTAAREGAARHNGRVIESLDELLRSGIPGGSRASDEAR
jgi:copper chaperone NosL